jgi:purine-binding chemotaxis protein CheW
VERVVRYTKPTPLPNLPNWLEGVLDYQGRVVPVVDLRARFGLERREPLPESRIILFTAGEEWIGAVVDAVLEVTDVPVEQMAPPPKVFRGLKADYLRGLLRRDDGLIIFLDVPHLLSSTERLELRAAMETKKRG